MAQGRMLQNRISNSRRLALLKTDTTRLLYTWIIAHLDVNGCFYADPKMVGNIVFTRLDHTDDEIRDCLEDIAQHDLIMRYEIRDEWYLWYPDFLEKQNKITPSRQAKPVIPPPHPDLQDTFLEYLNEKYGPTHELLKSSSGVTHESLKSNSDTSQVKSSQLKSSKLKSKEDLSFKSCVKNLTEKITLKIAKDQKDMAVSKMCGMFDARGWCVNEDMCSNIIMCVVNKVGLKSDVNYMGPYFSKAVFNWVNEHAEQINQTVKNIRDAEGSKKTINVTQLGLFKEEAV